MINFAAYHLKRLLWFRGWMPTHWVLRAAADGVTARCTWVSEGCVHEDPPKCNEEIFLNTDNLVRSEIAAPGSIPALMGFDLVICDGEPGSAILNKPLGFPSLFFDPSV